MFGTFKASFAKNFSDQVRVGIQQDIRDQLNNPGT